MAVNHSKHKGRNEKECSRLQRQPRGVIAEERYEWRQSGILGRKGSINCSQPKRGVSCHMWIPFPAGSQVPCDNYENWGNEGYLYMSYDFIHWRMPSRCRQCLSAFFTWERWPLLWHIYHTQATTLNADSIFESCCSMVWGRNRQNSSENISWKHLSPFDCTLKLPQRAINNLCPLPTPQKMWLSITNK